MGGFTPSGRIGRGPVFDTVTATGDRKAVVREPVPGIGLDWEAELQSARLTRMLVRLTADLNG